ncbi:RDD family protein [Desulfoluna butyratoxydans]|uniref:Rdd n=1 Tax=Desulfoluna butyratoxydans TaxID=231438 RepID=A0A4U8YKS2_9BACT|nr:RDD family protein [Desulfoluna butyratoxydans]VFQ44160.1 rdd [Desulfoluna butyratoxydans]
MKYEISGFWVRVGALFVDALILCVFGLFLGLAFSQQFAELGGWGRAIGFPIAAMYFVILNSRFGGGQTIGKRVFKVQVVDKTGKLLNLTQSTLRYSIIGIPYFLNGAIIPESIFFPVVLPLVSLLVFGFGISIIYLSVFNRNTRQSLHDIITGTYVIRKDLESDEIVKPIWSGHYAICTIIMVLALLAPIFSNQLSQNEFFSELTATRKNIQNLPHVVYATIQDGQSTTIRVGDESKTTTYLNIQVIVNDPKIDAEKFAAKVVNIALESHKEATQKNQIQVVLTYGYDIGIASKWISSRYSFAPEYWLAKNEKEI